MHAVFVIPMQENLVAKTRFHLTPAAEVALVFEALTAGHPSRTVESLRRVVEATLLGAASHSPDHKALVRHAREHLRKLRRSTARPGRKLTPIAQQT